MPKYECDECQDTGKSEDGSACPHCQKGTDFWWEYNDASDARRDSFNDYTQTLPPCPDCSGTGKFRNGNLVGFCQSCNGTGKKFPKGE